MRVLIALLFALGVVAAPALAVPDPPYLKLAEALGMPHLAAYDVPTDRSQERFQFTADGESITAFKRLATVSILKIAPTAVETETAARGVIARLRDGMTVRKSTIVDFDESKSPPVTLFYRCSTGGDDAVGIVYSPRLGFVTAVQIDAKNGGRIGDADVAALKSVIAPAR